MSCVHAVIIRLTKMIVTNATRFGREKAQSRFSACIAPESACSALINQVLDLSKIEACPPPTVQLGPLIDEVIGAVCRLAQQNKDRLVLKRQRLSAR
jgi:hypothetical protein